MLANKRVLVRIHDLAEAEWKQFLAELPGTEKEKQLLVCTYVMDWVKRIAYVMDWLIGTVPEPRKGTKLLWECPFHQSHCCYFALTGAADSTIVYITGVKPTSLTSASI